MNEGIWIFGTACFSLFGVIFAKVYLDIFLTERSGKGKAAGWLLFFLWQMYSSISIFKYYPGIHMFGTLVIIEFMGLSGYTSPLWKRFTFSALLAALWVLLDMFFLLGAKLWAGEGDIWMIISLWLSKIILLAFVMGIRMYMKNKGAGDESTAQGIFFLLPFMAAMTVYFAFYMAAEQSVSQSGEDMYWLLFGTGGMILLHLLVYPAYLMRIEEARIKKNESIYVRQLELFQKQKQLEDQETIELHTKRHDLKQKLIYIHELAKQEEKDKLMEVLDQMIGETVKKEYMEEWTGNLVVDSLVNHLYREAHRKNIRLDTRIKLPKEINIKDTDLCILQGNAYDNAMEALEWVEEEDREMRIEMKYERGCLLFCIKNRYAGDLETEEDGKLITRKKEGIHGLGIRSMKKVTDKYNGVLVTEGKDGVFTLKAILYEPKKI
jgi:hypothetical protein